MMLFEGSPILLTVLIMIVGTMILLAVATILYARDHAIQDQQQEDETKLRIKSTEWNLERARNHYGEIPCANKECECANNKL